ncbi:unnamed protein product [Urochloa humidicola]
MEPAMEPRDGEFMDKALVLSPATQAGGARFAAMGLVEAAGPGHSGVVAASCRRGDASIFAGFMGCAESGVVSSEDASGSGLEFLDLNFVPE